MLKIFGWIKPVGQFLRRALGLIDQYVTEENIATALTWVRVAASKFDTNDERREWVVRQLVSRGASELLARLAVEMAVLILKKEQAEHLAWPAGFYDRG